MPKAVIFDVDGTLVDSVDLHARAWQDAFRDFGHDFPLADLRGQIGKGGDQLLPVFLSEAELEEKGKALERHRSALFKARYMDQVRGFPDVPALFERLRADGVRIALASSAKADELGHYKRVAGVDGLTDVETSSDDAEKSKPHPDIFEAALDKLGDVEPAEALVVGDSPYDAEAAGRAGIRTIGLLCGGFPEADLRRAGCIAIYADPAELLAQYGQSPLASSD
ncbi:MAG: HAD family hydrolase [Acetobacteraceae bacterium]|nr:HAD family hydrolase [Acetobacteraceae bacterium]